MIAEIIACVFLLAGLFVTSVGVLGVTRMPDVYGRLQASTCLPSMGNICLMVGAVIFAAAQDLGMATIVKLVIIMLMILCTNPVSNHALLKGAYKGGVKPAKEFVLDDYKEDDVK